MKNIVIIIDSLVGGGAETINAKLGKYFLEQNYKVHLIYIKDILKIEIDERINLITLNYEKKKSIFNNKYFANKLKDVLLRLKKENKKLDLIIGNLGLSHKLMNIIDKEFNFYYTLHGTTTEAKLKNKTFIKKILKKIELEKLYNNKNIICVSHGIKEDILTLKIKPKSIQVIYNPFDFDEIKNKAKEKQEFEINEEYIIHVGRFAKVKRHDILIKAFNLLKDKNIKLLLVGEGERRSEIEKLVKELKLEQRVIFAGFQINPYPLIKNAKALILSSQNEGFGNVLVEAMILGTKIASTNAPVGPEEILGEEFKQFLSKVNNYNDLSENINNLLSSKTNIKEKYFNKFNKENILKKYKNLLV